MASTVMPMMPGAGSAATYAANTNLGNAAVTGAADNAQVREPMVKTAVQFLSHPKVMGSPAPNRVSFLEQKGLNTSEIAEALRRVVPNAPETSLVATAAREGRTASQAVESLKPAGGAATGSTGTTDANAVGSTTAAANVAQTGAPQGYGSTVAAPVNYSPGTVPVMYSYPGQPQLPPGYGYMPQGGYAPYGMMPPYAQAPQPVQPPPQSAFGRYAKYAVGVGTLLSLGAGVGYLARRYWNTTLDTAAPAPIQQPNANVPLIQTSGTVVALPPATTQLAITDSKQQPNVDKAGPATDRFGLAALNGSGDPLPNSATVTVGNSGGTAESSSDTKRALAELMVRVGDLADIVKAHQRDVKESLRTVMAALETLQLDPTRGRSDLQRELKLLRTLIAAEGDANAESTRTNQAADADRAEDNTTKKSQMNGRSRSSRRNTSRHAKSDESDHDVDEDDQDRNSASSLQRLNSSTAYGSAYAANGDQNLKLNNGGSTASRATPGTATSNYVERWGTSASPNTVSGPGHTTNSSANQHLSEEGVVKAATFLYESHAGSNADGLKQSARTLLFYLNNIITNPDNPSYRKLSTFNKRYESTVQRTDGAQDFLISLGFDFKPPFMELTLPADNPAEKEHKLALIRLAKEKLEELAADKAPTKPAAVSTVPSTTQQQQPQQAGFVPPPQQSSQPGVSMTPYQQNGSYTGPTDSNYNSYAPSPQQLQQQQYMPQQVSGSPMHQTYQQQQMPMNAYTPQPQQQQQQQPQQWQNGSYNYQGTPQGPRFQQPYPASAYTQGNQPNVNQGQDVARIPIMSPYGDANSQTQLQPLPGYQYVQSPMPSQPMQQPHQQYTAQPPQQQQQSSMAPTTPQRPAHPASAPVITQAADTTPTPNSAPLVPAASASQAESVSAVAGSTAAASTEQSAPNV